MIVGYLLSLEGITPTIVEEMEGRHRITTYEWRYSADLEVEEMEGRHRITTSGRARRHVRQWKRWKEDIESQLRLHRDAAGIEWKRWKEDIESQLPVSHRADGGVEEMEGRHRITT